MLGCKGEQKNKFLILDIYTEIKSSASKNLEKKILCAEYSSYEFEDRGVIQSYISCFSKNCFSGKRVFWSWFLLA
jgi:hypothetical protein